MVCLPWILGSFVFSVVIGDDVSDFLKNKVELKAQRYEGDVENDWDLVIKRDPRPFKLSSNPYEEEIGEMGLGLPVSQDVVFSRRRSVIHNMLPRNDVDEVSEVIEPGDVSPTYSRVEGSTGGQIVYVVVLYALCSILISTISLVGFILVRSVRHSRKKPADMLQTEVVGTVTMMEAVEGSEIAPFEEQPGPSNVAIEIDSPSTTESDKTDDDIKSSPGSSDDHHTVTVLEETQL